MTYAYHYVATVIFVGRQVEIDGIYNSKNKILDPKEYEQLKKYIEEHHTVVSVKVTSLNYLGKKFERELTKVISGGQKA